MATNNDNHLDRLRQTIRNPSRARARYVSDQKQVKQPWESEDGTIDWETAPWSTAIRTGIGNLPSDALQSVGGMSDAFKNWELLAETSGTMAAQSLWKPFSYLKPEKMMYGFMRGASPGALPNVPDSKFEEANRSNTQLFDAVVQSYIETYGSSASIKRYIAEHPAQFIEDAVTIGTMLYGGVGAASKGIRAMGSAVKLTPDQQQLLNFNKFIQDESGFADISPWELGTGIRSRPLRRGRATYREYDVADMDFKDSNERSEFIRIQDNIINDKTVTSDEQSFRKRLIKREKQRNRRQRDPEFSEYQRESNRKSYNENTEFAEGQRESARKYYRDRTKDPEGKKKERKRNRKRYHQNKSDRESQSQNKTLESLKKTRK